MIRQRYQGSPLHKRFPRYRRQQEQFYQFLSEEIADAQKHNLRAAFLLGLCHGFEIEPLALQYENSPAPLDYRDFIRNSTFRKETFGHVEAYCAETLIRNQEASSRSSREELGLLGQIDLGSPVAEYETQRLSEYFVRTAEYVRAVRAEGAIVTGRKGSGKSAVYSEITSDMKRKGKCCIVDLHPASHNLSEMREALLSVVSVGVFDHTIAAFWRYVLMIEVVLKIREYILPRSKNDFSLQERIRLVESKFGFDEAAVAGDFTSRLAKAIELVADNIRKVTTDKEVKSQITNLLFQQPIAGLRDAIISFRDFFDEIIILIDDLDKGWPPLQVELHDISTLRHLVEELNDIQRDLRKRGLAVRHIIFLRSDVYERLVERTSDRSKYNVIKVDWSDPVQLRYLIQQRVINNLDRAKHEAVWAAVNPGMSSTKMAVDYMIEISLRRPRFLIDLMERTLSFSINRGHRFVAPEDVEEGARQMSLYLVSDFAYEMRDIAGTPEDIFYRFIGSSEFLTHEEVLTTIAPLNISLAGDKIVELLLWYGFLGIINSENQPVFIYDRAYDFRRLEAERGPIGDDILYAINQAFLLGLQRE